MPLYVYICETCGKVTEVMQAMNDYHVLTCTCGEEAHQDYASKGVKFTGELPTTGGFSPFYDSESKLTVTSQKMWDDVRKRTGRVQWEQDPEHKAARDEALYMAKHAKPGDKMAVKAGEDKMREVHKRKAEKRIESRLEKCKKDILRETSSMDIAQE